MNTNLIRGNVKEAMKGAKSRDLWQVPLDELHVMDGFNVRTQNEEHTAHVSTLVQSILANGFRQDKPLAGYVASVNGKSIVYLTDGHCRLEAVRAANGLGAEIETLPVVILPNGTAFEDLTVGLIASNQGKPLTPYEQAEVCKRLVGFGWDETRIAKRCAMTPAKVTDLLTLIGAPLPIREAVAAGDVSATTAISTIKKDGDKAAGLITDAVRAAKAAGKRKATNRDIKPDRVSPKALLRELVTWADSAGTIREDLMPIIKKARKAVKQ